MPPRWEPSDVTEVRAPGLTAQVVAFRGGKVISLRDDGGREWLAPCGEVAGDADPAVFTDAEMGGWDECVPTIDACTLLDGTFLPDHGEAWNRAWRSLPKGSCGFDGSALPYRFGRRLVPTETGIRFAYRVEALGTEPLPFLWAAHPQFLAYPGTRVEVPGADQMVQVHPGLGDVVGWSREATSLDSLEVGESRKVYAASEPPVGEAALVHADGARLSMAWTKAVAPYVGIWLDNAGYAEHPVVAIEPTTGFYDNAARAIASGQILQVVPGQPVEWHIDVEVPQVPANARTDRDDHTIEGERR